MGKDEAIKTVKKFSDIVAGLFPVEKIILFGSYARNEQRRKSDIDVAVVVKQIHGDYLESCAKLFALRNEIDYNIEPHLFEEGKDPSGFLEEINKTGVIIFQKN